MKLNRKWPLLIALIVSVAMASSGTLAYLTDRDSDANVFTVGNVYIDLEEEFDQGSPLIPGINIEKKPVIKNTGKNDAYVWLLFSIPSALDNYVQGTEEGSNENIIHWNPLGATTEGYVTQERVDKAIADGHLPAGITADEIISKKMHWNVFNSLGEGKNAYQEKIDDVDYNHYVLLYNKVLTPGETTLPNITKVFLDAQMDIDPNGDFYRIVNGQAVKADWNIKTNGNPVIYASAYAIQADGMTDLNGDNEIDVRDALQLYMSQWNELIIK